jgi:hypothetical protein
MSDNIHNRLGYIGPLSGVGNGRTMDRSTTSVKEAGCPEGGCGYWMIVPAPLISNNRDGIEM